jgi:hypothetical protein
MTDAINTNPKTLLDTVIFDGTEAFMKESRRNKLREELRENPEWTHEAAEIIDRGIDKSDAEQIDPERSRNQRLKQVLDDEQAWMSENEEAIDRAIEKFEAEQIDP